MSLCILNRFTVNTNGGNLIRTCYSETRRDYLIIRLVIVHWWNENLPLEWNKIIPLPFFHKFKHFIFLQQEKSEHIFLCMFLRKQGYRVTNFARKTKVSFYKCCRWKVKLSRLLVQHINEFKMNEIQLKTPQ